MKKLWIGAAIMLILLATLAVPYDNSDDPDDLRRSGMIVFTDHLTGCQYLGRVVGGLTPNYGMVAPRCAVRKQTNKSCVGKQGWKKKNGSICVTGALRPCNSLLMLEYSD